MIKHYGLVHSMVTPFDADRRIDWATFERLVRFHLANGADALAVQLHAGESVSLSDAEQRETLAFVMKQVAGRVPESLVCAITGTRPATCFITKASVSRCSAWRPSSRPCRTTGRRRSRWCSSTS